VSRRRTKKTTSEKTWPGAIAAGVIKGPVFLDQGIF
jgi:hypothetical protein